MNGRGKTKPYTMDDYIKDREQSWGKTETGSPMQAPKSSTGGFTVSKFTPPLPLGAISLQKQAMERSNQATGTVTTPPVEAPSVSVNVGSEVPEGGTVGAVPLTDVDVYKYQMDQARQKVYDVLNRKFKYNAKDSPLYTIMQQQYEREAERAAGRAYSSAVANTGGYGSSYATLAGEEARRQVMEGMDEAQYELYQAARQEFMDERQSAVDWYSQARQMYLDKLSDEEYRKQLEAEAGKTMSDSTYKLLIEASENGWYKEDNENLLHAKLETYAAGDPSIDVDTIMGHLRREYDAWQADTEAMTEKDVEADVDDPNKITTGGSAVYAYVKSLGENGWTGNNETAIRAMLNNVAPSYKWTAEDIESGITALKNETAGAINDAVKQFELNPTVSGAAELMDLAKETGTESVYQKQASAGAYKGFTKALTDPSTAYATLGKSLEDWNALFGAYENEDERAAAEKAYVLETAGEARKAGYLSADDYMKLIGDEITEEIKAIGEEDGMKPASQVASIVISMQNYKDAGYLTQEEYDSMLDQIVDNADMDAYISRQAASGNENIVDFAENTFNKIFKTNIDLPRWAKKTIGIAADVLNPSDRVILNHFGTSGNSTAHGMATILDVLQNSESVGKIIQRINMSEDEWDALQELIKREEQRAKNGG